MPATLSVFLLVLGLAALGLLLIVRGLRAEPGGVNCPERICRHRNEPGARFCARCGAEILER